MTEPDERPGGPDTPPSANPAPPAATPAPEGTGDDTVALSPPSAAAPPPPVAAAPPAPPAPPTAPTPPPAPVPTAAPAPTPPPAPVAPAATASTLAVDGYDVDLDDYVAPRWVALATTAGAGIVGVVALQVVLTFVEGFSVKNGKRFGVPDDLLHRIGYPFGSLGSTAVFFLLLGVVLLALPTVLGEEVSDRQYSIAGVAMKTVIVLAVIIGLGSLLAVRGSLHEYSAKSVAVPGYVKVQFTNFLLATLASSGLAVYGALAALRLRDEG